ncbi:MAG: AAA family ATPase [Actinomycetota bacterium]
MAGPLIVVTGLPGSGKTTLARRLRDGMGWPLLEKDVIKEALFEAFGTGDLAHSQALGGAAHAVLSALAAEQPRAIVEAFFRPGVAEDVLLAMDRPLVQVHCACPVEEAVRRYRVRIDDPARHPGHTPEHQSDAAIASWADDPPGPLHLPTPPVVVDTTVPVDIADVIERIEAALGA